MAAATGVFSPSVTGAEIYRDRGVKITEPMHECDWVRKRSFTAI